MKHHMFSKVKTVSKTLGVAAVLAAAITPAVQAENAKFRFITNWYAQEEHGGFYQAEAEGLYAAKGLDVSVKMGGPQVNSVQIMAAGQAECIIRDDISTMMAQQRGIPMTMVAGTFQHDPTVIITHSDVKSLADLKGHTVLISSSAHSAWWPWAKKQFGFTDKMARPYTFNIQPFMADSSVAQQGYMSSEPFAMKNAGADYLVYALGDEGYPPYGNSIACRDDVIKEHPEQVQAFIEASMQGWKNYLSNPAKGNELIQKENPNMTTEQLAFAVEKLNESGFVTGGDAATKGIGIITDERMKATWDMVVENELIDGKKVPLAKVYTTEFVTKNPVMP